MSKRCSIDTSFFKRWTIEMAYILGFLYADGNLVQTKRGSYYFSFYSGDKNLLVAIREKLKSTHAISKRKHTSGKVYRMQIGSKTMVSDLIECGLDTTKAHRLQFPAIPEKYIGHFVRGYFDGDGNVWVGSTHLKRKKASKAMLVSFTSCSKLFLKKLHLLLEERGVQGGSLYSVSKKQCSRLSFSTRDSLKIYKIMYNGGAFGRLGLKRKKDIFDAFIKMRT